MTPFYDVDGITIYHGDCLDVLPLLGERADLIVTSPPYNLGGAPWPHLGNWKPGDGAGGRSMWRNGSDAGAGIQYDEHDDTMPWDEYVGWQRETWRAMWGAISDTGAIYWVHKTRVIGGRLWRPDELIAPELLPFLRQEIIWARSGGINYNPTAYVPTHERVLVVAKEPFRLRSKSASGAGDVWRIHQASSDHPAPFPLGVPATAIETTGPGVVLDPFMGSGTTLRAAADANVRAIGIEKSERYCRIATERLSQQVLDLGSTA